MTISELLADYEPFHSEFQLLNLVVMRNGITLYGCYKQALREIAARLASITQESRIGLSQRFEDEHPNLGVILREYEQRVFYDRIRELAFLIGLATSIKRLLGPLRKEERVLLEEQYWHYYLRSMVARDLVASGCVSIQTVDLIHAMPIRIRQLVLFELKDPIAQQGLIDWYTGFHIDLPEPDAETIYLASEIVKQCLEIRVFLA